MNLALENGLNQLLVPEERTQFQVRAFDAGFRPGIDLARLNALADSVDLES